MTILPLNESCKEQFADLLAAYFPEVDSDIPEAILRERLLPHILSLHKKHTIYVDLLFADGKAFGFSIYQIDTPESDWCKRPGWGFIREFYILPQYRRQGFGKQLALHTEQRLKALGAKMLYLTSGSGGFWTKCGWMKTDAVCSNGLSILEKE